MKLTTLVEHHGLNESMMLEDHMKLVTSSGQLVMAHFHHQKVDEKLWNWETLCTVHLGPCKTKERPCNTESSLGVARTSRKDVFYKSEGRKLAMARALSALARELRAEVWAAYLKVHPPRSKRG
jgi:hypothetical protein